MAEISKEELLNQMMQPLPPTIGPVGSLLKALGISEDQYNQFTQNPVAAIQGILQPAEGELSGDRVEGLEGFRNLMNPVLSTLIRSTLPYMYEDPGNPLNTFTPAFTYAFPLKKGVMATAEKAAPELKGIGHWMNKVKTATGTEMEQWQVVKEAGDMISNAFSTVGKATEKVPVLFGGKAPKAGQLGGFLEGGPRTPTGEIELYEGSKGGELVDNFLHEVGHSLWKAVPKIRQLYTDLWKSSPQVLKDSLKRLYPNNKLPELIEEFGNYHVSKVLGESLGYKKSTIFQPPPEWAEEVKNVLGDPDTFVMKFADKVRKTTSKETFRTEDIAKGIIDEQRKIISSTSGGVVRSRTAPSREVDLTPRTPEAAAKDIRAERKAVTSRTKMYTPNQNDIQAQSVGPTVDPQASTKAFIDQVVNTASPKNQATIRKLMEERLLKP